MASTEDILSFFYRRQQWYRQVFNSSPGKQVLADLQEFCCADRTTMRGSDPLELARNEGRRQVWLRIIRALNLSPEQQFELASQKDHP